MRDLNDKVTGNNLDADEWNEPASEIQNVIEGLGITLSGADLDQLGKAIAGYVANGNFYTDSGAADAYVLSKIGNKQTLPAYTDGMEVEFLAGNTNTGASTVNVAGLGVRNITDTTEAGRITAGVRYILKYRLGSGDFEIFSVSSGSIGSAEINTGELNPIVQEVNVTDGAVATSTTVMPYDDTIPQNTEGGEFISLSITPKGASNKLRIEVTVYFSHSAASVTGIALFQDSTADALAACATNQLQAAGANTITFTHYMVAGTISNTTFKVRIGSASGGTLTFNGQSGTRRFGGVSASSITITEILQ